MRVPLSWLKDYVDITTSLDELADRLSLAGLEVGSIERIGDWWDRRRIVVGEVVEVRAHPDAERLVLADVEWGGSAVEQCVTGAPNLFPYKGKGRVSLKVAYAMEGAELYDGHKEGFVKTRLKPSKIRGVPSRAMVCSEKELGISEEHEGILFLPDDAPVGAPLADYLGDTILDLDLTPNLARCLCMVGAAREVAALTGAALRLPPDDWRTDGPPAADLARVEILDPDLCSRYIATLILSAEIGPSPAWMQQRLKRAGLRPINNVVDITNYVMLEWGQPLHAFDYDKLVARAEGGTPTIIVRRSQPGESMRTLDGVDRTFGADTLLICDTAGPIAVAGVMGGAETEIDDHTRNILLEAANFHLYSVRRTTQALKLPSEASLRFGRGIHPSLPEPAARRAGELMRVLAGGTIARGMVDAYPRVTQPVVIDLTLGDVERSLGMSFDLDTVVRALTSLEFVCEPLSAADGSLQVTVPPHRLDCSLPADLIEEVARIHGYDKIPVTELADRLPPQRANRDLELEEQVRDILAAAGLQEIVTHSLTTAAREALLVPGQAAADLPAGDYVTISNPISPQRTVMRRSLLASVLEMVAANIHNCERVCLFEVGKVYLPRPGSELPREPRHLVLAMTGPRDDKQWLSGAGPDFDYFDLKGVVESLMERLHVSAVKYVPTEHAGLQPGRTARILVDGAEVGIMGELHPLVREAHDLPGRRVAVADIDLEELLARVPAKWFVSSLSSFPAVLHDLAVVVPEEVPAADVQDLIAKTGGFLLKQVRLFDLYRGEPVASGKKSLAYSLTFQAPDKTLSSDIVAKQVQRIAQRLRQELGAELRA